MKEAVVRALFELEQANGDLRPEDVIEAAKDPTSPLHSEFEWNLERAAHRNWMDTARGLIREVRVIITTSNMTREIKAYVHRPDAQPQESIYANTSAVRRSPEQIRASLTADCTRIAAQLMNTLNLAEYWGVDAVPLHNALREVEGYRAHLEFWTPTPPRRRRKQRNLPATGASP